MSTPQGTFPAVLGPLFSSRSEIERTIDDVYSFGISGGSGKALAIRTVPPGGISSVDVKIWLYCSGTVGTLTDLFQVEIRNAPPYDSSDDDDRPEDGSVVASSDTVTPSGEGWYAFTLTNISLPEGEMVYFILKGLSGVDGSNNATWISRSEAPTAPTEFAPAAAPVWTTDGFNGDPTVEISIAPFVIIWDHGGPNESYFGNPYVKDRSGAMGTNYWRGTRISIPTDVDICGAIFMGGSAPSSGTSSFAIFDSAGTTVLAEKNLTKGQSRNTSSTINFSPVSLKAGTLYDVVFKTTSNSAAMTDNLAMAELAVTVPQEVKNCAPFGDWKQVLGTTPGSFTTNDDVIHPICLFVHKFPALSGGASARWT